MPRRGSLLAVWLAVVLPLCAVEGWVVAAGAMTAGFNTPATTDCFRLCDGLALYVAFASEGGGSVARLLIVNVSDAAQPVLSRVFVKGQPAATPAYRQYCSMAINGSTAFVGILNEVFVVDIASVANPRVLSSIRMLDNEKPSGLTTQGAFVHLSITVEDWELADEKIFKMQTLSFLPSDPVLRPVSESVCTVRGVTTRFGYPTRLDIDDDRAYLRYEGQLLVFDSSDPEELVYIGPVTYASPGELAGVQFFKVRDGIAYVVRPSAFQIVNVTDAAAPVLLLSKKFPLHRYQGLAVAGEEVLLGAANGGVVWVNVSDPAAVRKLRSVGSIGRGGPYACELCSVHAEPGLVLLHRGLYDPDSGSRSSRPGDLLIFAPRPLPSAATLSPTPAPPPARPRTNTTQWDHAFPGFGMPPPATARFPTLAVALAASGVIVACALLDWFVVRSKASRAAGHGGSPKTVKQQSHKARWVSISLQTTTTDSQPLIKSPPVSPEYTPD
eukprot:gene19173-29516_t